MAVKQTRKSISLPGELFDRIRMISIAKQIPMSQLAIQAFERFLAADDIEPARPSADLGHQTSLARHGADTQHAAHAAREVRNAAENDRAFQLSELRGKLCAVCANEISDRRVARLCPAEDYCTRSAPGETVPVCVFCEDLHPRDAGDRYDLGRGAVADIGLGEGNHRAKRGGVG